MCTENLLKGPAEHSDYLLKNFVVRKHGNIAKKHVNLCKTLLLISNIKSLFYMLFNFCRKHKQKFKIFSLIQKYFWQSIYTVEAPF